MNFHYLVRQVAEILDITKMLVKAIKTRPLLPPQDDLLSVIKESFSGLRLKEGSIIAITSKVVAIWEGRCIKVEDKVDKDELIKKEADFYLPSGFNKYGFHITIKKNTLIASAGIDESNANGYYILWPKDPQKSANKIRGFLKKEFGLSRIGVVITDSHVQPLRCGTVGTSISHSGFNALNSYIGKPDIFDRKLKVTNAAVAEGIAAAAVLAMGEGKEQTPIAIVSDVPFVNFVDRDPTKKEIQRLAISKEEDIYSPLLKAAKWKKGKGNRTVHIKKRA